MDNNEIEKKLKARNVRPTAMRELVYKALYDSGKALSLSELEGSFDQVERSTIFRALKTFEENLIVHTIEDGTGSVKYAVCDDNCSCTLEDLHVHFYCTQCDRTQCLKELSIPKVKLPEEYVFQSARYVITGICSDCK